ncbi:MAG: hypothetical protein Q7S16_01945 [bacterium]|nr:hypothetical protein [bacterium]
MFFALAGFFAGLETFYFLSFDEDRHYIFTPPQEARWWSKVVMFLFVTPPRIFLGITKPAIVGTHEIFTDAPYRKPDFSLPAVPWTQVRENV